MNENHARLCSSPEWAEFIQTEILPPLTRDVSLGSRMLEVGPGPGAATEWLRHRVEELVAAESDPEAARALCERFVGSNVSVVHADARHLDFGDASFDAVGSFTMLHHVPTTTQQNQLLGEIWRVLRPGGVLIGSDSLASTELHEFHEGDVYNPVEPASFLTRLQTLGFDRITLGIDETLTFVAHKPVADA